MADRIISGTPVDYAQEKVLDLFCNAAKQYMVRSSIKNEINELKLTNSTTNKKQRGIGSISAKVAKQLLIKNKIYIGTNADIYKTIFDIFNC